MILAEYISLQRGTNDEQVHFPVLQSADSVLRSRRNFQIKPEYKSVVFKLGCLVAIWITYFLFFFGTCFLWSLGQIQALVRLGSSE